MSLRIPKERRPFPWVTTVALTVCVAVVATVGWHGYRWYAYGVALPVELPALASSGQPLPDETKITAQQTNTHTVAPHEPRYLGVPSLGITKARIIAAEADQTGFVKAPIHVRDISWYSKSAAPGTGGVILLSGHLKGSTQAGLFAQLSSVQPNTRIEVTQGDGKRVSYVVRDVARIALEDMQATGAQLMTQPVEPGRETLILTTRDGVWVPRYEQYSHRIVVRAVLAE